MMSRRHWSRPRGSSVSTPRPSALRWRRGEAEAVLAEREARAGVDRVLAIFPDGRAYGWHQLNGSLE